MRGIGVLPAGSWDISRAADCVSLDHDRRHRRRIRLQTDAGQDLMLDLPQAVALRDGDGLELAEGGVVRVVARPEPLAEIHAHDAADMVRIAWHLGNRHLPVQLLPGRLRIRRDHVIEEMVARLGGHVAQIEAPFDPEAGAYAGGHRHHADGHAHDHAHGHAHGHAHD